MALQQQKNKSSLIPNFPRESQMVDNNGNITTKWHTALSNLYQNLQGTLSNEGIQTPPLSGPTMADPDSSEIAQIAAKYQQYVGKKLPPGVANISGKVVYDYTNETPKVFVINFNPTGDPNGVVTSAAWKTFTLT